MAVKWNDEKKLCGEPMVHRGDSQARKHILGKACSPTIPLDEILRELFEKQYGEVGIATYYYLREPFYNIAHDTCLQDSIFWAAIHDEFGEDPYDGVFELYALKAKAGWNENDHEMFVFIEE